MKGTAGQTFISEASGGGGDHGDHGAISNCEMPLYYYQRGVGGLSAEGEMYGYPVRRYD